MKKLLTIALLVSMFSCGEDEPNYNTWEVKTTFPDASFLCICAEIIGTNGYDLGYTRVTEAVEYYFRKGRKCEELGYIEKDGSFYGPNNGAECGPNGYFVTGS